MQDSSKVIKLHENDNIAVVVSTEGLLQGVPVASFAGVSPTSKIPNGHKIALKNIRAGELVIKFGHAIGQASRDIGIGDHVHTHNVIMPLAHVKNEETVQGRDYALFKNVPKFFNGYARKNGRPGVRNYIVVVATVNCSSTVVKAICQHFKSVDLSAKNIDGIIPITHSAGCAQAIGGLNFSILNKTIAGWAGHPNVVANLFIGLGCEGTTFETIREVSKNLEIKNEKPERHFNIQDVGGTSSAIKEGIKLVEELVAQLPKFERTPIPLSGIGLALNCGGSDAYSSLTANPALGVASDILVFNDATSVLAEIPECHGAEELLASRAQSPDVVEKLNSVFDWWTSYSKRHNVNLNNNLSPGNIEGGITTIIEKSLGAVSKGGTEPLADVVGYSEQIPKKGFALMNTPGFDPVSVTGLVAGGCNLVCFTTGRGSVYGCSIAPTIKISTNTPLYTRMNDDIDFNAGEVINGATIEKTGLDLLSFIIEVANGKKTKSELNNLGWEEFTPWPIGETL